MVGWAKGGGVVDVASRGRGALSNPTEQEAGKRDDQNPSSSSPVVDIGVGVDASVDGSDLDGTSRSVPIIPAGQKGQCKEDGGLVSGDVHVRAGVTPEELGSEERQLQPHAVASSTATSSGPSGPGLLEARADAENGDSDYRRNVSGGHSETVPVNAPNGGEVPADARGAAEEQMTAHSTGTKAVRSLSRGGGGGGAEASTEMEEEGQANFESKALSSTHVARSCGEPPTRERRKYTGCGDLQVSPYLACDKYHAIPAKWILFRNPEGPVPFIVKSSASLRGGFPQRTTTPKPRLHCHLSSSRPPSV